MQRIEAIDEYNRAQRLGMRDYREKTAAGKYPYLPALDELLEKTDTESQIPLGTIEIPLDYVVGTKTTGRTMAFASNFMPLLPEDTEFASKWLSLCMAHMEEGIHDAIKRMSTGPLLCPRGQQTCQCAEIFWRGFYFCHRYPRCAAVQ